jgi:glycine betaine/proline transport system substrate-binding protein
VLGTACGGDDDEDATAPAAPASTAAPATATPDTGPKPTIKFGDTQFESLWINNAIARYIIENAYGYPVETIEMTTPIYQASLANGDIDVQMELWKQNIIDWYDEEIAAGNIENLGMTYEGGPQFWIVPDYTAEEFNIKTIEDMKRPEVVKALADPEDPDKGAFINCIIGWQCAEINRTKFKAYGLDEYYNIVTLGSVGAMDAGLIGPQKAGQHVFGYYWAPTSLMGLYDWTIIEEPAYTEACWEEVTIGREDVDYTPAEACAYDSPPIDKGVNSGLRDKAPDVVELFEKMNVGLDPINKTAAWALTNDIDVSADIEETAEYYLLTFEDRWTQWMPADKVAAVKAALAE